jgi:hypothetical protein
MSKCQKNKYFNVGCQPTKCENKEFQQSFASLMAAREAQDSLLQNSSLGTSASASSSAQHKQQPQTSTVSLQKPLKKSDIDLILEGDI